MHLFQTPPLPLFTLLLTLLLVVVLDAASTSIHRSTLSTSLSTFSTASVRLDADITTLSSQSHLIADTIVSHARPLKEIIQHLTNLEETFLNRRREVETQSNKQKMVCKQVTETVQNKLYKYRIDLTKVEKNAAKVDAKLGAASKASEQKSTLLLQLQLQGVAIAANNNDPMKVAASALDNTVAKDEIISPGSKPIKVIASSLADGQADLEHLQQQRRAAYTLVEDAKDRVAAATRHLAELAQECAKQKFVFEELSERLNDRGKAVHQMLAAVHEKRLNIKIFLDEAKRASGGARVPPGMIEDVKQNGGCLWSCAKYEDSNGIVVDSTEPKKKSETSEQKKSSLPAGSTCLQCSEDGVAPLPRSVVDAMTFDASTTSIKEVTGDVQTLLSTKALDTIGTIETNSNDHNNDHSDAASKQLASLLNTDPSTGSLSHAHSIDIRKTHEAAITSVKQQHAKALAQIKQAVTMAYLHQASKTSKGSSSDDVLADALAVAREGAVELLHATHEEAVATVKSEHRAALNDVKAQHRIALQSMGVFGSGSQRIAAEEKVHRQHAEAVKAVVARHQQTMDHITQRVNDHHTKTLDAVQTIRKEHERTAKQIDSRHEAAINNALNGGKSDSGSGSSSADEAALIPSQLHGVQGNSLLVPAVGLELALDSSLLMCRFGLNVDIQGWRVVQESEQKRTTFLKCAVPEWTPAMSAGQQTVSVLASLDGGKTWFGDGKCTLSYGIPTDVKEETEDAVEDLQTTFDQWERKYTVLYAKLNATTPAGEEHVQIERELLAVRYRRDQARQDLNAATVAFVHYMRAKTAAEDLYQLGKNATVNRKKAERLQKQSDTLREHAHAVHLEAEKVLAKIGEEINANVNTSIRIRNDIKEKEQQRTEIVLDASDTRLERTDLAAGLLQQRTICAKYKSAFDADTATVSDLTIQSMAPGDATDVVASRRLSHAALPRAQENVKTTANLLNPCLKKETSIQKRLGAADKRIASSEATSMELRAQIQDLRERIKTVELATNDMRANGEAEQKKYQWAMRVTKEAAYKGQTAASLELTTFHLEQTRKSLLEAKKKAEVDAANRAAENMKVDVGRVNNFMRPWEKHSIDRIPSPQPDDDCIQRTGRRVGPAMHPCGTKPEFGEGPLDIPALVTATGPEATGSTGGTGGAGMTGSSATGTSATGSNDDATGGGATGDGADRSPATVARRHGCEVEIGERWCPFMALCYNLNEGDDACNSPNEKQIDGDVSEDEPSEEMMEVLLRYTGIVPDGALANYTDNIVEVPCFEKDEETPCAFNNNPIVLVEALKTVRRRRDYVRDQIEMKDDDVPAPGDSQEQVNKWDDLRDQYGRSENLIVARFAHVCNKRTDTLENLKGETDIAKTELEKRRAILISGGGGKDELETVQKESEDLLRDVQSMNTQTEDATDDVNECDEQRTNWELFSNHTGYATARDNANDSEEEEEIAYMPPSPVHLTGSIQLSGALTARVVLFRKAIRSVIAAVLKVDTMQVQVNLDQPTAGPTYSIDVKIGSREQAQKIYHHVNTMMHSSLNQKITDSLNAQGLISLKSTSLTLEAVEGADAHFHLRDANSHNKEIHSANIQRKKQAITNECQIRSGELSILKRLARSLQRRYTSAVTMDNRNLHFVRLVRQYGAVRKQIKYDVKFVTTHGCPPLPENDDSTNDNGSAMEAAMKAADNAESQLASLSGITSAIAAAQNNVTLAHGFNSTNNTNSMNSTNSTNSTSHAITLRNNSNASQNYTAIDMIVVEDGADKKEKKRNVTKLTGDVYITGLPSPIPVDALGSGLAEAFGVDPSDVVIEEVTAAKVEHNIENNKNRSSSSSTSSLRFPEVESTHPRLRARRRNLLANVRQRSAQQQRMWMDMDTENNDNDQETRDVNGNVVAQEVEDGATKKCRALVGRSDGRTEIQPKWCYHYSNQKEACEHHFVSSTHHPSVDHRLSKLLSYATCDFDAEDGECTRSNWMKCGSGRHYDQYDVKFNLLVTMSDLSTRSRVSDTLERVEDPDDTTGALSFLTNNLATAMSIKSSELSVVVASSKSSIIEQGPTAQGVEGPMDEEAALTKEINALRIKATSKLEESTTLKKLATKLLARTNVTSFDSTKANNMLSRAETAKKKSELYEKEMEEKIKQRDNSATDAATGVATGAATGAAPSASPNKPVLGVNEAKKALVVAKGEERVAAIQLEHLLEQMSKLSEAEKMHGHKLPAALLQQLRQRKKELSEEIAHDRNEVVQKSKSAETAKNDTKVASVVEELLMTTVEKNKMKKGHKGKKEMSEWMTRAKQIAGCRDKSDTDFTGTGINSTGYEREDIMDQYFDWLEYCKAHRGVNVSSAPCVLLKSRLDGWENEHGGENTLSRMLRRWYDDAGIAVPRLSMTDSDSKMEKELLSIAVKLEKSQVCHASFESKTGKYYFPQIDVGYQI